MKKIGILGGLAWPSTVDYYTELCRRSEALHRAENLQGLPSTPEMSIESLDMSKAAAWIGTDGDEASWLQFDEYHRAALKRLEASGADFAVMASNTPHHRFATIVQGLRIPVINIFQVVAKEAARIGARQVLILGTALTMRSAVFQAAFTECGIEAAGPSDEQARVAITMLIAELQRGQLEGAAAQIGRIAKTVFERQFSGQPVVCLACTELPLAFSYLKSAPTFVFNGMTYINSSAAHIAAAFDLARLASGPHPAFMHSAVSGRSE
jgi:aspartate racemase